MRTRPELYNYEFTNSHYLPDDLDEDAIQKLRNSPDIVEVEKNQIVRLPAGEMPDQDEDIDSENNIDDYTEQAFDTVQESLEETTVPEDGNFENQNTDQETDIVEGMYFGTSKMRKVGKAPSNKGYVEQLNPPSWGLSRISSKTRLYGNRLISYKYPKEAGEGVNVYVLDTGCTLNKEEYQDRIKIMVNFSYDFVKYDINGHGTLVLTKGTHVTGTIASKTYGVAKKANIICVKVLGRGGDGSTHSINKGIQYVINSQKRSSTKCVANISITGDKSGSENSLVTKLSEICVVTVAAGNYAKDAKFFSPSSAFGAITVGNSDINDEFNPSSNFGDYNDINAPGTGIVSLNLGGRPKFMTGTSMAAPHCAGVAAIGFSCDNSTTPRKVVLELLRNSIPVVNTIKATKRLLYGKIECNKNESN